MPSEHKKEHKKAEAAEPKVAKPQAPKAAGPPDLVLTYTPIGDIAPAVERLNTFFHEHHTHPLQYRLNQLRNLYWALKDNCDEICDALYKDFGRAPTETKNLEYAPFMAELVHMMALLHQWARPEPVKDLPLSMKANPVYVEKTPLGVVLVIAPFNYPLFLSLGSLVAALAAGNCVVLKVLEFTPHFAQLLTKLLTSVLDPGVFAMVNGAVAETTALLDQKFDKIMYTGLTMVGTIIAKKAAETLTPVLLELGGKSPAFVLEDVLDKDLEVVARRIAWGRFINAGQTCVAIDYVLAHELVKEKLVKRIVKVLEEQFYNDLDAQDVGYTHIIHQRAYDGLVKMIENSKGKVVSGGTYEPTSRYIAPTVIDNVDWEDLTMQQEIFGPVLPVLLYTRLEDAVKEVVRRHDTPLALYIFTSKLLLRSKNKQVDLIRTAIRSGGTIVNDSVLHVGLTNAPFGGIGTSGQGLYHGYYLYRAFSHERTTMEQNLKMDFALKVRYPPYEEKKDRVVRHAMTAYNGKVWFGRNGNVPVNGPSTVWSWWTSMAGVGALLYYFASA